MATEVLTSKDQIRMVWKPYAEANWGDVPGAVAVDPFPSWIYGITPRPNPNTEKIHVLRGEAATAGIPLLVDRHFWEYGLRIECYQPTLANWANSWQRYMMKTDATFTNFWCETKLYHSGTLGWYLVAEGVKPDTITIRAAKTGRIEWLLDCWAETIDTASSSTVSSYNAELTPETIWMASQSYWRIYDGSWADFPDIVEDFEVTISRNLYQRKVFTSGGGYGLSALDEMGYDATVRATLLTHDRTYLEYLLDQDELDLRLMLPDTKQIDFTDGKFQRYEPDIRAGRDMIRARLEFNPEDYSENF